MSGSAEAALEDRKGQQERDPNGEEERTEEPPGHAWAHLALETGSQNCTDYCTGYGPDNQVPRDGRKATVDRKLNHVRGRRADDGAGDHDGGGGRSHREGEVGATDQTGECRFSNACGDESGDESADA